MNEPFVKIDLHGLRQEEAVKVIDRAIAAAGPGTYQLHLVHGYNRGTSLRTMIYDWYKCEPKITSLRTMIYDWYKYEPKIKRIMPGDNPGITVLVLKELY